MSIEEFRGSDAVYTTLPNNLVLQPVVVVEVPKSRSSKQAKARMNDTVSFKDVTTQNEMVRSSTTSKLKRNKPLASHDLLVKTLGVQILDG